MIDMKKALQSIDDVIEKGPYKDTWASLSSWQTPKWYQKAKFGIFIHWGVYSVPAFDSEWYPRNMYIEAPRSTSTISKPMVHTRISATRISFRCLRPRNSTRTHGLRFLKRRAQIRCTGGGAP